MEKKILSRHEYNLKMANQYVSVIDRQLYALDNGGAEGTTLVPIQVEGMTAEQEAAEVVTIMLMCIRKEALQNAKTISNVSHLQGQAYGLEAIALLLRAQGAKLPPAEAKGMDVALKEIEAAIVTIRKAIEDNAMISWDNIVWESLRNIPEKTSFGF